MDDSNVVDLEQWKQHSQKDTTTSFHSYYAILNFNELINESRELAKELKTKHLSSELIFKANTLLDEFDKRLHEPQKLMKL